MSSGALPEWRRIVHAVRGRAMLPGALAIWTGDWVNLLSFAVSAEDVGMWPCSVGFLLKWVIFLVYLALASCWGGPWGRWCFSFIELLILYERCAGERLVLEKAVPRHPRPGRPISVSAVPLGPGIDIWRSCRFIGALSRSLCALPGGIGWFIALFGWC